MSWADAEEAKELKELGDIGDKAKTDGTWKPSEADKSWMDEEIKKAKELYGEDFGENISEEFE
jgi:hypothetical protein